MTWNGKCAECGNFHFRLEMSSGGWVNVHCAHCDTHVGRIPEDELDRERLVPEPH